MSIKSSLRTVSVGVAALFFSVCGSTHAALLYGVSGDGLYSINIANLNYGAVSTRLGFTGNSGGSFAMQDIAFAPEVAAIPEPATYTMLMAGMVLLGLTFHRNKQNTSTMLGMA